MTKSKTMLNSRGDSIPTYIVKPYEKQKNRLVNSIHKEAVTLNAKLAAFREKTRDRMLTFCKKCYADAQVKMRGDKGNLTLSSYDNLRKVQISVQNTIAFDERLSIARDLINEYLDDLTEEAPADLRTIVNGAFHSDAQGNLRTGEVLRLRTYNIKAAKWVKAMDIIMDSIVIQSTKEYVRIYQRPDNNSPWEYIQLNIASA